MTWTGTNEGAGPARAGDTSHWRGVRNVGLCLALLAWCVPAAVWAQQAPTTAPSIEPKERPAYNLLTTPTLTGDWGGARTELAERGITAQLWANIQYAVILKGPETENGQRGSGSWDLLVNLDLEKMGLIPGGQIAAIGTGSVNGSINPKVGALAEPIDDADYQNPAWVPFAWYQQSFFDKKVRFRFGYFDEQGIVDRNEYTMTEDVMFMNTFLDNQNAIVPLTVGFGACLFVDPVDWFGFSLGVANGEARIFNFSWNSTWYDEASYFTYFEPIFRVKVPSANGPLPGNYRFGMLYDPRRKVIYGTTLGGLADPDTTHGDYGFYLSFDQKVWRESPDDMQGLGWFLKYGYRDGKVNAVQNFWATGFEYMGPIPTRDKDRVGLAVYQAQGSERFRDWVDPQFLRETGYELYYNIQVLPWLTISPDVQYIVSPGARKGTDDAIVMALRFRVTF